MNHNTSLSGCNVNTCHHVWNHNSYVLCTHRIIYGIMIWCNVYEHIITTSSLGCHVSQVIISIIIRMVERVHKSSFHESSLWCDLPDENIESIKHLHSIELIKHIYHSIESIKHLHWNQTNDAMRVNYCLVWLMSQTTIKEGQNNTTVIYIIFSKPGTNLHFIVKIR